MEENSEKLLPIKREEENYEKLWLIYLLKDLIFEYSLFCGSIATHTHNILEWLLLAMECAYCELWYNSYVVIFFQMIFILCMLLCVC